MILLLTLVLAIGYFFAAGATHLPFLRTAFFFLSRKFALFADYFMGIAERVGVFGLAF